MEFKVVKHKKKRIFRKEQGTRRVNNDSYCAQDIEEHSDFNVFQFCDRLAALKNELSIQALARSLSDFISSWCGKDVQQLNFVCYGLGKFVSCLTARYQFVVFQGILENLEISNSKCCCFDPAFTREEISVLEKLEFSITLNNEEGKHSISELTVFYMPHCGKALYNNLLWANWSAEQLKNIIIIGNSFTEMKCRLLEKVMESQYKYVYNVLPYIKEEKLNTSSDLENEFSDTVLIHFTGLDKANELFWVNTEEPTYKDDVEIIKNSDVT